MKDFVLDASIALAWCFSDEATNETVTLLENLETATIFVPSLWTLELGNVLLAAKRRQRITQAGITEFLALLEGFNIQFDNEAATRGFHEILALAAAENMTTYDATYLELAMRLGLPLATKDKQLQTAAARNGIVCL